MEQFHYPVLSRLAFDVLAIHVSTVTLELVFSIGGRVIDQYCTLRKESADLEKLTMNPSIAYT
ncbi:hypothetical protein DVH24_014710 [Malus domestica]|uniref:HAT C-terminal dimerisation domain-containing protein n=1 Tax=Malus domestica TaxID=3750 RepID=A0A498J806_MALDO|nr:hypothetical protein DVH24_006760 [Malus domestica]RXH90817.1 hypothetical protein DVH24_006762 [Malus domestica]RXH90987.1 hypothetical protein DVH24_014706 [Malus domestica]RXH90991.1 hypothetical protein DVH24_014710 [Malus domestica]